MVRTASVFTVLFHIVLFRPRAELTDVEREAFIRAIETARREIPTLRRFDVGRRVMLGRGYERAMKASYDYAAVLQFDDRAALEAYLDHPAHAELGRLFGSLASAMLVYDYEMEASS